MIYIQQTNNRRSHTQPLREIVYRIFHNKLHIQAQTQAQAQVQAQAQAQAQAQTQAHAHVQRQAQAQAQAHAHVQRQAQAQQSFVLFHSWRSPFYFISLFYRNRSK
jgi:hypothetical protein